MSTMALEVIAKAIKVKLNKKEKSLNIVKIKQEIELLGQSQQIVEENLIIFLIAMTIKTIKVKACLLL